MDYKLMATTFAAVFLAELGDKTQLATLTFAAGGQSRWAVFLGSAVALVCTSAIAVLAGEGLVRVVPAHWLKRAAGALFLVMGVFVLWSSWQGPEGGAPPGKDPGLSQPPPSAGQ